MSGSSQAPPAARAAAGPLSAATRSTLERHRARYPQARSAILPCLWAVQEEHGWLSPEGMAEVASVLGMAPSEVEAVSTFYSMYFDHPTGRHHVLVCINAPCALRGADDIVDHLERSLGVPSGGTTEDGAFTWEATIECLGGCGYAPMMQVDHHFHEHLTPARVDAVIEDYRARSEHAESTPAERMTRRTRERSRVAPAAALALAPLPASPPTPPASPAATPRKPRRPRGVEPSAGSGSDTGAAGQAAEIAGGERVPLPEPPPPPSAGELPLSSQVVPEPEPAATAATTTAAEVGLEEAPREAAEAEVEVEPRPAPVEGAADPRSATSRPDPRRRRPRGGRK